MSELYKEIPTDLPPEARLRTLFDVCLEVGNFCTCTCLLKQDNCV